MGLQVTIDPHRSGAENMRQDRAMLDAAQPAVRLYGWRPGCVSLGYTQKLAEAVDADVLAKAGLDHVERPTGGGAILHDEHEVTYAVVLPHGYAGMPDDLYASYRFLADPVLAALRGLGLDAEYRAAAGGKDAFCYLREAGVAITVHGRKISGGAQRRTREAVLQHGTVIMRRDAPLLAALFRRDVASVRGGITSLHDESVAIGRETVLQRLADEFMAHLTM